MNLSGLLCLLPEVPAFRALVAQIEEGQAPQTPLTVHVGARAFLTAALAIHTARPTVLLMARSEHAHQVADQLRTWAPNPESIYLFGDPDALPYERVAWSNETRQQRLTALTALAQQRGRQLEKPALASNGAFPVARLERPPIVVASARALMQKTLPPRELRLGLRQLALGDVVDLNRLLENWVAIGYEAVAVVDEPGTFSRRGGILDVWPPNLPRPARIELFGDEIDSIRFFDPNTQRTLGEGQRAQVLAIGPASEALAGHGPLAAERVQQLDLGPCHPPAQNDFHQELDWLAEGQTFRFLEWYLPYLYSQPASLLDYLPDHGLLIVDDGGDLAAAVADLEGQAAQLERDQRAAGELPGNVVPPFFTWSELKERMSARAGIYLGFSDLAGNPSSQAGELARAFAPGPRFGGKLRRVAEEVHKLRRRGSRTVLVTRQAPRLAELFNDEGITVTVSEETTMPPEPRGLVLVRGLLSEGFIMRTREAPEEGDGYAVGDLVLFSDAELFGWTRPQMRRQPRKRALAPEAFFADVAPGDHVVHMEHGIGKFAGLVQVEVDGQEREYLQVDYAQGDRLFVPVHQADRLSRYVGPDEGAPVLHRLGTADWNLVKQRARRAVADIAHELLELYARREVVPGHAFSPDSLWQEELEASFPYIETDDQLVAIEAVKHDMEKARPMDRLICGDVGYGKTEVALRAAFKAVMDGKQVAILVPTTVLAQQHYQTFAERLAAYPVNVDMLSRFRSRAQQQRVLQDLYSGRVDIVIGTHRLLSRDVEFKDLGLVIIDEEQRFGVGHKERLKRLRTEVDVLTLTATPIPRTLHMSLTGVRDLSVVDTPPEERLPIKTTVAEYDETLIRHAVLRELDRGGQVFFVHNMVQGIEQIANRLRNLMPDVLIEVAHGQMPERQLERVMIRFAEGEVDVLVCTTIIESGLDIPNANTMIINRADRFGLAQLYQLRGRVGRSAVRAYCYLLYNRSHNLSPIARRRLEAILEASDLGAGFRIAMRDLEIRGAGDLLGARQHGHIAAVGFDLYCRLLAQAVQDLRKDREDGANGSLPETHFDMDDPLAPAVTLDLPLAAFIPEEYIPEAPLRLQLYRRIAGLTQVEQVDEMRQELTDRFGEPPVEVENLLWQVKIKVLALRAAVQSIGREAGQLVVRCEQLENLDRIALQRALGGDARVSRRQIWLPLEGRDDWAVILERTLNVMIAS